MIVCKHCGKPESEHCIFEAGPEIPPGCVCDEGTWADKINPICEEYQGDGTEYCQRCEHDAACHGGKP